MSRTEATTPLIKILTESLRKAGASQEEIDEQRSLGLARLLVKKVNTVSETGSEAASDPIVGCFFTEGGRHCTLNLPLATWENIRATLDPGATSGPPVPPVDEGCI